MADHVIDVRARTLNSSWQDPCPLGTIYSCQVVTNAMKVDKARVRSSEAQGMLTCIGGLGKGTFEQRPKVMEWAVSHEYMLEKQIWQTWKGEKSGHEVGIGLRPTWWQLSDGGRKSGKMKLGGCREWEGMTFVIKGIIWCCIGNILCTCGGEVARTESELSVRRPF